MRITLLGTGDAFGSGGRFSTCLHVALADGGAMLVDCAATSLLPLRQAGFDRNAISTLLFTHFHGDHFGGLPFFLLDAQFVAGRKAPLTIAGPKGVEARTRLLIDATYPGYADVPNRGFDITYREVTPETPATLAGVDIAAFPMIHDERAGPCQGYRLTHGGKVFAFSGDTSWTDSLVPLADGADALVVECNSYDRAIPSHLDYLTLSRRLPELKARRIVITHMGPQMLSHDEPLAMERAVDGMVIQL
jgi:ribonuclease BN (tRNA processing enzyme)